MFSRAVRRGSVPPVDHLGRAGSRVSACRAEYFGQIRPHVVEVDLCRCDPTDRAVGPVAGLDHSQRRPFGDHAPPTSTSR